MKKYLVFALVLFVIAQGLIMAEGPKLSIRYEDNAQFELTASDGVRVLIDVYNPKMLSAPATAKDILLTTHTHSDHYMPDFVNSFPGKQLMTQVGEIKTDGVYVRGIASAHSSSGKFMDEKGSNYIYLIEIAGLRIAHFGGIGQEKLTPEQLKALGKIDIALTPLASMSSDMDAFNMKGFNLMDQIKPRIVIPTHNDMDAAKEAVKVWQGFYLDKPDLVIDRASLPQKTQVIFMGPKGVQFGKITKVPKATY